MNSPKALQSAPHLGAIGLQPYGSRNLQLSSALWAMGFAPKIKAQPTTVVVDFETKQPVVTFWHEMRPPPDSAIARKLPNLVASHIGEWWNDPKAYSIEGYDDALRAMRRVREMREWCIKVVKGAIRFPEDGRNIKGSVATDSLHIASVIKACDVPLITFRQGRFVFGKEAAPIAAEIAAQGNFSPLTSHVSPSSAPLTSHLSRSVDASGIDPCIDWMLAALHHGDALKRFVRGCIPLIEKRDGDRCLRISSQMPKTLRREFTRRF